MRTREIAGLIGLIAFTAQGCGDGGGAHLFQEGQTPSSGGMVSSGGAGASNAGSSGSSSIAGSGGVSFGGSTGLGGGAGTIAFGGAAGAIAGSGGLAGRAGASGAGGAGPSCEHLIDVEDTESNNYSLATTDAICLRITEDIPQGWNCSNMMDRTVAVNGIAVKCGDWPLPPKGDAYLFAFSAGEPAYASIYWW